MPLLIERNDITKIRCDAVVNAANNRLAGGGGVDGAIHRAAGPELHEACMKLGGCPTGQAKITEGFRMPCQYIIHTVGPIWMGGGRNEAALLASCYRESLRLAAEYDCHSVAFPLISAGAFGYPKEEALRIAVEEIRDFLRDHEMTVILVVFDRNSFRISRELLKEVAEYIDERYVEEHSISRQRNAPAEAAPAALPKREPSGFFGSAKAYSSECEDAVIPPRLDEMLSSLDESFSEMLLRKIDEKGMTDAQCYKRANIDRKLFSKIRANADYKPSKPTVIAFAIALELTLDETKEMLMKAGFALSRSSKFDVIIEYFIRNKRYDIFEINEVLFSFDQMTLG